jgi:osmotically-inducible protein OsmY
MKTAPLLTLASSLFFASVCAATDSHDADRAIEASLKATVNDKHIHFHVKHGIVTVDGKVRTVEERNRIDSLVRSTTGVVALKDELKVTSPSPGVYPEYPPGVPVYSAAAPETVPGAPVVTMPAPVVVPDYPKIKVQALTEDDTPVANRLAHQLRADGVPLSGFDDVEITVRNRNISLRGVVDSQSAHDSLISSLRRVGGTKAIYDQLRIR